MQAINVDIDSAILNEEKWMVQKPGQPTNNTQEKAAGSEYRSKAVSHLSRMSLYELNKRNAEEMNQANENG